MSILPRLQRDTTKGANRRQALEQHWTWKRSEIEPTDDVGGARNDFDQRIADGSKEGARAKPEPPAATSAGHFTCQSVS